MDKNIEAPILGRNLVSFSRTGPGFFEFKKALNSRNNRISLHFMASTHLVGGIMFGLVTSSYLVNKITHNEVVKSFITIVPIATEWDRIVSVISHTASETNMTFPTLGQGAVFGTVQTRKWFISFLLGFFSEYLI